jgi:hypothetical protein
VVITVMNCMRSCERCPEKYQELSQSLHLVQNI